jgi:hypothetical protein
MHAHHPPGQDADVAPRDELFPPVPKAVVTKVARACKGLPEVTVEDSAVGVQVKVRRRVVARLFSMRDPEGAVKTMLVFRADPDERRVLLAGGHPFFRGTGADALGMVLEADTDWTEVRELVTESYLIVAPKSLAARVTVPETGSPPA